MSDATGSGERKATAAIDKGHISNRSALIMAALGVVPLTLFIANLSAGQVLLNTKIDNLIGTMEIRRANRDVQYNDLTRRVDDHETRIRTLEARKP